MARTVTSEQDEQQGEPESEFVEDILDEEEYDLSGIEDDEAEDGTGGGEEPDTGTRPGGPKPASRPDAGVPRAGTQQGEEPDKQPGQDDRIPFSYRAEKRDHPIEGAYLTADSIVIPRSQEAWLRQMLSEATVFRNSWRQREQALLSKIAELDPQKNVEVQQAKQILETIGAFAEEYAKNQDPTKFFEWFTGFVADLPHLKRQAELDARERAMAERERGRVDPTRSWNPYAEDLDPKIVEQVQRQTDAALEEELEQYWQQPEYALLTEEQRTDFRRFLEQHRDKVFLQADRDYSEEECGYDEQGKPYLPGGLKAGEIVMDTNYVRQWLDWFAGLSRGAQKKAVELSKQHAGARAENDKLLGRGGARRAPTVKPNRQAEPNAKTAGQRKRPEEMSREEFEAWFRKPLDEQLEDLGVE